MILLDLHHILMPAVFSYAKRTGTTPDLAELRRSMLHSILSIRKAQTAQYGKLVIATDGWDYWRRSIFPYYKHGRKARKEKVPVDWTDVEESFRILTQELRLELPYPTIFVMQAEADDIIGSLVSAMSKDKPILIVSGDQDFIQLHTSDNIKQVNWTTNTRVTKPVDQTTEDYLREKILRGDAGDGIPNVLSPSSCFAEGVRQTRLISRIRQELMETDPAEMDPVVRANYERNALLIDLKRTPVSIKTEVFLQLKEQLNLEKPNVMSYLIRYRLRSFIADIEYLL